MENFTHLYWETLRQQFDRETFNAFIKPTALEIKDDTLFLSPPNKATERWLRKNIEEVVRDVIKTCFGRDFPIDYHTGSNGVLPEDTSPPPYQPRVKNDSNLPVKYSFANFIPGRANEIPLLAAKAIARGESAPNPLFIYGSTGLGKTHLIQAIGNEYIKNFAGRRVRYITARTFLNEVVQAFRLNRQEDFKRRYQNLDLLIVDDIQYIGGDKVRTQEEFFFLFNTLYEDNKSIVISCDRAPLQIKDLPRRLTTRFCAGLPTHITPPEFELRMEIVRQKAAVRGLALEEDAVYFIAEHAKANVRELEGAINRIHAMAQFQQTKASLALCRNAIADLIGMANILINPDLIKEKVARFYYLRTAELSSQKRHRSVVIPRHVAVYLCRQMTTLSLPDIGRHFGKRNHTTVLHSCRYVEERIKNDSAFWEEVKTIETSVKE